MYKLIRARLILAISAIAMLLPAVGLADGDVDDGRVAAGDPWILDNNNWQQGQDMLPDVILNRVKKGDYWYKVQPIRSRVIQQ